MPESYYPLLLMILVASGFVVTQLVFSTLAGSRTWTPEKQIPYESGMRPRGTARGRFSIHFYLVAMLFIVFDVEVVFLFPWAVEARALGGLGFLEVMLFLAVLVLGLAYVWRKGGLEWD